MNDKEKYHIIIRTVQEKRFDFEQKYGVKPKYVRIPAWTQKILLEQVKAYINFPDGVEFLMGMIPIWVEYVDTLESIEVW